MESIAITSRAGRIWKTAGTIWLGSTAALAVLVLGRAATLGDAPGIGEWIVVGAAPAILAQSWLLYLWLTSARSARRLTADATGVTIERPDGQVVALRWEEIRGVDYNSLEAEVLALRTHDTRHAVLGYGFDSEDWSRWLDCVTEHVGDEIEYRDTQEDFDAKVSTGLDWTSIAFAVIGGGATVALLVFLPSNAAGWIALVGTAAILIYLEHACDQYAADRIPIAKYIGFYAAKALAIIPLVLVALNWVRPAGFVMPAHKHAALCYLSNTMFFGGMAAALLVRGGFSPTQYYRDELRGVNRFQKPAFVAAVVICAAGFALKVWNEG